MHVVDHAPHAWFLLRDGDAWYLDVNTEVSAVGFSVLVRLADDEVRACEAEGRAAVERLAAEVEAHLHNARDLTPELGASVSEAVARWRVSGR